MALVKDRTDLFTATKQKLLNVLLSTLLLFVFLGTTNIVVAQGENPNYLIVRFIIEGLQDNYHASLLDEELRTHPDIWMSRSDFNTKNYLGFFDPNTELGYIELKAILTELGLELRCFQTKPFDGGPIEKIDPRNCSATLLLPEK